MQRSSPCETIFSFQSEPPSLDRARFQSPSSNSAGLRDLGLPPLLGHLSLCKAGFPGRPRRSPPTGCGGLPQRRAESGRALGPRGARAARRYLKPGPMPLLRHSARRRGCAGRALRPPPGWSRRGNTCSRPQGAREPRTPLPRSPLAAGAEPMDLGRAAAQPWIPALDA